MTRSSVDWDDIYRRDALPAYSIGMPQPELSAIIDQGKVRSEVLDAGCGHAALALDLAAQGYSVTGLDISEAAVSEATAEAAKRGLSQVKFSTADMTDLQGYDARFATVMDSGCFHSLPVDLRSSYVRAVHRAAAPGASLFILAFSEEVFESSASGPGGFTAEGLRETVGTLWSVDEVRSAKLYASASQMQDQLPSSDHVEYSSDGSLIMMPGFLLTAHKA